MESSWYILLIAAAALYAAYRTIRGRLRFRALRRELEAEGVLLEKRRVLTGLSFPMIRKLTFAHVVLTRRRFIALHWITRNMIVQAPLGAEGAAGTEKGRFEIEHRNARSRLVLRTTLRGGGKIRFRLRGADAWLRGITENQ